MLGFSRQAALNRLRRNITLANVLAGNSRAPVSVQDLYLYLKHVEYSVENLQFLLWYQDYRARFFDLPEEVQQRSPPLEVLSPHGRKINNARQASRIADAASRCPRRSRLAPKRLLGVVSASASSSSGLVTRGRSTRVCQAENPLARDREDSRVSPGADAAGGASSHCQENDYKHNVAQPFRDECMRVAAAFFTQGSAHELSLDQEAREFVLSNLEWNTHPDVFLSAYYDVYALIETSSFPQFLVAQSMNINMPRRIVWCLLGVTTLTFSIAIALCCVMFVDLSSQSRRAFRLVALPFAACGAMQMFSAYQGFCTLVWWSGKTQVKEWELSDQSIIKPFDPPLDLVDHELGTTQDVASHQPLSQVEQIAPFIAASALPSAPLPAFLAKSLGPSELPSRSTPMTPRSSSDDPLSRKNPSVHPDSSTQVSSRRQIAALEISEEIIDGVPPFAITALPESILLDHDVKSQASREPSIASSRCPVRTRLLGRGPVFGRQKEILDPRIISAQGKTFRSCMLVGIVATIFFASIILPIPARHVGAKGFNDAH